MSGLFPAESVELTGGRWVRRGGIQVWIEDPPKPEPEAPKTYVVVGQLCECGCLILPDETCPACLVWAIRDAERAFWRQWERANRAEANHLQAEAERRISEQIRAERGAA